jgi:transketolase
MANAIRALAIDAVEAARSGHPGMPMGMADVAAVLWTRFLKFDSADPHWPDRDRLILSAGHGSMLLYAGLHLLGYKDFPIAALKRFRQLGSPCAGHPEFGHGGGIETTTGPLGQGLGNSVGFALAERVLNARIGDALVDHHTYVIASDGDLMEGISHEAISLAGHLRLSKLIVLFDDNGISIDGPTSLSESGDAIARFEAAGWHALRVDGHDPDAVARAIEAAQRADRPSLIACRTIIGFGAPNKQGTASAHGAPLGKDEAAAAKAALNWPHPSFEIPEAIRNAWAAAGERGAKTRAAWETRLAQTAPAQAKTFKAALRGGVAPELSAALNEFKKSAIAENKPIASRKASERVLEIVNAHVPETIGGSADLTESNLTRTKGMEAIEPGDYSGRFIHYGVREHGMAAAMNGMALHGGVIPYSGTFLVFSDYCRPSIRLAALMGVRVIHVMTHDSIGLGEDGPTHQPIEHLWSLRAIPNCFVFRPADIVETAECWELALKRANGPSILALSRQNLPLLRTTHDEQNRSARGAYVLSPADGRARATLIATGSEVAIALEAQKLLKAEGVPASVVSMPCTALFDAQDKSYRDATIPSDSIKISIEAGGIMGWERYTGQDGAAIGMQGFGASAPIADLYRHFGITAEAIVGAVKARM